MIAKAQPQNAAPPKRFTPTRSQVETLALAAINATQEVRGLPPYGDIRCVCRVDRHVYMRALHAALAEVNSFILGSDEP